MALTYLPGPGYIFGIPKNPDLTVKLPDGIERARVRFRNNDFARIFYREGERFVHRLLLDKGDHFEVSDFISEQGRNRKVAA